MESYLYNLYNLHGGISSDEGSIPETGFVFVTCSETVVLVCEDDRVRGSAIVGRDFAGIESVLTEIVWEEDAILNLIIALILIN